MANLYVVTIKVGKGAKIRNRYNQAPHLTQDTNGKVTNSQLDTTNESLEVSPFPAGDHMSHINRRLQRHVKHKKNIKDPQKKYTLERSVKYLLEGLNQFNGAPTSPIVQMWIKTHSFLDCIKVPYLINASSPRTYQSRYKKKIKQRKGLNSK